MLAQCFLQHSTLSYLGLVVVLGLEIEVISLHLLFVELGCSSVYSNHNFVFITSLVDSLTEQLKTFLGALDVGREASLVPHVDSVLAIHPIFSKKFVQSTLAHLP